MFLKEVSYANQGYIYLIKTPVKTLKQILYNKYLSDKNLTALKVEQKCKSLVKKICWMFLFNITSFKGAIEWKTVFTLA